MRKGKKSVTIAVVVVIVMVSWLTVAVLLSFIFQRVNDWAWGAIG